MFAPTEKFAAWLPTTKPAKSFSAKSIALFNPAKTSPPIVFILDWNSRLRIPSPISSITTPEFLKTSFVFLILSKMMKLSCPGILVCFLEGIS